MFGLRPLHYFTSQARKLLLSRRDAKSATPERTNIITIIVKRKCNEGILSNSKHVENSFIDTIFKVLKVDLTLLMRIEFFVSDLTCSPSPLFKLLDWSPL